MWGVDKKDKKPNSSAMEGFYLGDFIVKTSSGLNIHIEVKSRGSNMAKFVFDLSVL